MINYTKIASLYKLNQRRIKLKIEKFSSLPIIFIMTILVPFLVASMLRFDYAKGAVTAGEIYGIIIFIIIFSDVLVYSRESKKSIAHFTWLPISSTDICISLIAIRLTSAINIPAIISLLICSLFLANNLFHFCLILLFSLALFMQVAILMQLIFLAFDNYTTHIRDFLKNVALPLFFLFCIVIVMKTHNSDAEFNLPLLTGESQLIDPSIFIWEKFQTTTYVMTMSVLLLLAALQLKLCSIIATRAIVK